MKEKIITARMTEESIFQIEYLKRHLNTPNTTKIITRALWDLYHTVREEEKKKSPFELMDELQLIGCFNGETGLSQNYKTELFKSISRKANFKKVSKKSK